MFEIILIDILKNARKWQMSTSQMTRITRVLQRQSLNRWALFQPHPCGLSSPPKMHIDKCTWWLVFAQRIVLCADPPFKKRLSYLKMNRLPQGGSETGAVWLISQEWSRVQSVSYIVLKTDHIPYVICPCVPVLFSSLQYVPIVRNGIYYIPPDGNPRSFYLVTNLGLLWSLPSLCLCVFFSLAMKRRSSSQGKTRSAKSKKTTRSFILLVLFSALFLQCVRILPSNGIP